MLDIRIEVLYCPPSDFSRFRPKSQLSFLEVLTYQSIFLLSALSVVSPAPLLSLQVLQS